MNKINSPVKSETTGVRLMAMLELQPFVLRHCWAANRGKLPFSHKAPLPFLAGRTEAYSLQTSFGGVGCAVSNQAVLTPASTECLWSGTVSLCLVCWCMSHYDVCFWVNNWSRRGRRYLPYKSILKLFLREIRLFLLVSVLDNFGYHFGYVAFVDFRVPPHLLSSLRAVKPESSAANKTL